MLTCKTNKQTKLKTLSCVVVTWAKKFTQKMWGEFLPKKNVTIPQPKTRQGAEVGGDPRQPNTSKGRSAGPFEGGAGFSGPAWDRPHGAASPQKKGCLDRNATSTLSQNTRDLHRFNVILRVLRGQMGRGRCPLGESSVRTELMGESDGRLPRPRL